MKQSSFLLGLLYVSVLVTELLGAPTDPSTQSLVVSSTEKSDESGKEGGSTDVASTIPKIYQMQVRSNISNRFARTTVISKVKNAAEKSQEATFSVVLPETAFISGFIMEINGKNYTAYVKEKEEAKRDYDVAVARGFGAAHVAVSARDSNSFTVSVNIEPETKAAFYLSYEQLLKRKDGHYEQVINIHPGQPVPDLSVEVSIAESRKVTELKAPPLRSGNEIVSDNEELDPRADIQVVNETAAIITFSPNLERQKQLAHLLKTNEDDGFAGQFVIQYDVERDPQGGEVLVQDGYFVHFFSPSELTPLPKHVVFVLDTSSSMGGQKIEQLRQAMQKILDQLHEHDLFNLVEFNTNVKVWDLDNTDSSVWYPTGGDFDNPCWWKLSRQNDEVSFGYYKFPSAYSANVNNIKKAKDTVAKLQIAGSTDIYTGLRVGLHLIELAKHQKKDSVDRQPIIVFLTDGQPNVRVSSTAEITEKITALNEHLGKTPIFALSFGSGADKKFLEKFALKNSGFTRHIYDAADASLQLQDFYNQISSPLLTGVTFKYEPSVTSLTETVFPILFGGSEIVVAGRCGNDDFELPTIDGRSRNGVISLRPTIQRSVSSVERLWAYMTIKQLLEKSEISEEKQEIKKKALDLALKYSFVTPLSSLVVVKPNDTSNGNAESAIDTESAPTGGAGFASRRRVQSSPPRFHSLSGSAGYPIGQPIPASNPRGDHVQSSPHRVYSLSASAGYPIGQPVPASYPSRHHGFTTFGKTVSAPAAQDVFDSYSLRSFPPATSRPNGVGIYPTTRPYVYTTPFCPEEIVPTQNLNLLNGLPWLNDILTEDGKKITLPTGNFKLGQNETISDVVSCPKTPMNAEGHCKLLSACPQVHSVLSNVNILAQHFCVLREEFAGICCPSVF